jgi:hypothetical protein
LEYIRLKAAQYDKEHEVQVLEKRLKDLNLKIVTVRSMFLNLCKQLPDGDTTEAENEAWLKQVKEDVEKEDLMSILDSDSDEESPDLPPSMKLPMYQNFGAPRPSRPSAKMSLRRSTLGTTGGRKKSQHFPLRKSRTKSKPRLQTQKESAADVIEKQKARKTRGKTLHRILLAPTKASGLTHKKATMYDADFEFQSRMMME